MYNIYVYYIHNENSWTSVNSCFHFLSLSTQYYKTQRTLNDSM